ncbi:MAG: patatin-like phospholipase family protein [Patescibacteria group bacterium]
MIDSSRNVVIENILNKRDKVSGSENIRPLLFILGGGMRGVYGAGSVVAFRKIGLGDVFSHVVGISTGAPIGAYFLAGDEQVLLGASIYYEECVGKEFINFFRLGKIVNIDHIVKHMRHGKKALDCEAIKKSKTEFYVEVTLNTGECALINTKTASPDMISSIHASMALPILYGKKIIVNKDEVNDGSFCKYPVWDAIENLNPTDVLILPNKTLKDGKSVLEIKKEIAKFCKNVEILWPANIEVGQLNTDKKKLKSAVEKSAEATLCAFGCPNEKITLL